MPRGEESADPIQLKEAHRKDTSDQGQPCCLHNAGDVLFLTASETLLGNEHSPAWVGCLNDGGPEAYEGVGCHDSDAGNSQAPTGRRKGLGGDHTKHEKEDWGVGGGDPSCNHAGHGEPIWFYIVGRDPFEERPVFGSGLVDPACLRGTSLGCDHVRATPHRSAARALNRVQELEIPAVEDTGVSCGNAEVAEWVAMLLGISGADIDSITFKERCRPRNPSMPTPSNYSDGEESLLSHPMTPLDRSPEVHRYEQPKVIPGRKSVPQPSVRHLLQQAVDESELLISEGTAKEVPATDKLLADLCATSSPTYNPTPLLSMPNETEDQALPQSIAKEAPPVLKPTPKLRSHATDPVPGPTFTLKSFGKVKLVQSPCSVQPTAQSQLTAEDEEALKWGGWPMMCPACSDWEAGVSIRINVPATTIECPPPPQHERYVGLPEEVCPPSCCRYGCPWRPGARAFSSILPRTPGRGVPLPGSAPDRTCGCKQLGVNHATTHPLCLPGHWSAVTANRSRTPWSRCSRQDGH